jgi:AraC family transcriptional regulator, chitin signaling transcriptional activator
MRTKLTSLFFILFISVFSQDLPPIVNYTSNIYGAGNQNWMISQDKNQFVFFANNEGLLEFNGSNWQLYPSPNETIIRSVRVIGDRIYTGSYMEFGFWKRKADGLLAYHSLSKLVSSKFLDDENIWNIVSYDQWVVFQSSHRIYIYDVNKKDFKIISPNGYIFKSFKTENSIYYQPINQGLYEIEAGMIRLVSDHPTLKNNLIVNVFAKEDKLMISTQSGGFYELSGNVLTKFPTAIDNEFADATVYSCEALSDGGYVVGTVSNGIFILSKDGKKKYHISQRKGLSNNTALSLFEDSDNNLWVGLDNGISCINLQSSIRSFVDNSGVLGTVYTSQIYNDKLYVGTNQGLFCKKFKSNDEFSLVRGTKGQVWSLFVYDGTLFCGHHNGTFVVDNGGAHLIFSKSGTWNFTSVPGNNELLLQGNYSGISVLEKKNNQWSFRNKLQGFEYSSKYLEITSSFDIYVSHEYKGVFKLETDNKLQNIKKYLLYKQPAKGKNAGLVKFNNTIYYAYKGGVFKLNNKTKQFEKDVLLSPVFEKYGYTSGKMIVDNSNKIWLFSKNNINYYSASKLSKQLKQNSIPIPVSLSNSMLGYENIKQLSPSTYFFGTTDGYYTINVNDLVFKGYKVSISSVVTNALDKPSHNNSIQEQGSFENDENNINFYYTVPEYSKYFNAEYQYMLEGFQDRWSEWSDKSSVNFKNLPAGDYVFKVRAKYANSNLDNTAVYTFTIQKPWYGTNLAVIFYIILGFIIIRLMHLRYKSYYHKKVAKLIEEHNLLLEIKELENEKQMMLLKNEQLSQDVDAINKELAVSAMSLNSKNELLAYIQEDLRRTNESDNKSVKSVISTINRNITGKDSWSVFQEAFDKTDKDFLKKMKEAHSSLTPNDLRLCAYLRLNLSSKEMAPLLNISVRSVEIKRYRLRKKMDLPHEQGLVEYILAV